MKAKKKNGSQVKFLNMPLCVINRLDIPNISKNMNDRTNKHHLTDLGNSFNRNTQCFLST